MRIGNAASIQLQLDVYGELIDALCVARSAGLEPDANAWRFEVAVVKFLERSWNKPDHGIWETRGEKRHFTHSKVMAWVAFDRAIDDIEKYGLRGPVARWRKLRARIHADICRKGFDRKRNTFVQYYGATEVDASLLLIPQVGFLPPEDPRVRGTIAAIERDLVVDGLVMRYRTLPSLEGLPPGEGRFLALLVLAGRRVGALRPVAPRRRSCSSVCWRYATTWDCSPKNTIRRNGGCWATFRRRSRTWRSSTPRAICRGQADPRSIAAAGLEKSHLRAARSRADRIRTYERIDYRHALRTG